MFLFAEAVAESARLGGFDPKDTASLPGTLDEALHAWLERAFPDQGEYEGRFRPLVGALLASPTPLPEDELGTPGARRDLSAALERVGDLARARGDLAAAGAAWGRAREVTEEPSPE